MACPTTKYIALLLLIRSEFFLFGVHVATTDADKAIDEMAKKCVNS
jgi:hypothetical protein